MIRQGVTDAIEAREIDHDPHFQWRGRNVTRIENLSDIVFAIALGMLVSASSAPADYLTMRGQLVDIVPISASFAIMLLLWHMHFTFFRRYGLGDGRTIFLNAVLLLLILFIAYPLRFIFDSLFSYILALFGQVDRIVALGIRDFRIAGELMSIYAIGYAMIFAVYALMYRNALSKADEIGLSASEKAFTRLAILLACMQVAIALIIAVLAQTPPVYVWASFLFFLNWPVGYLLRWWTISRLDKGSG